MRATYAILAVLLLLAVSGCVSPQVRSAGAPLYVVTQGNAKVYIFGGAAPSNRSWLSPQIEAAVNESKVLWRENPPGPPAPPAGASRSGTLFDDLSPAEAERVLRVADSVGVSRAQLAPLPAWAAGYFLSVAYSQRHPSAQSVDDVSGTILSIAQKNNAAVFSEFATWEDFPRFFSALPLKAQVQYTLYQLDSVERSPEERARSQKASDDWAKGDASGLVAANDHLRITYPELYRAIEIERNERWADRVEDMLKKGGVTFIDVGVQHTIGPESIQEHLKRRGTKVGRV